MGMSSDWPLAIEEGSSMIGLEAPFLGIATRHHMNWLQVRQRYERWFQGWLSWPPLWDLEAPPSSRTNFTAFGK